MTGQGMGFQYPASLPSCVESHRPWPSRVLKVTMVMSRLETLELHASDIKRLCEEGQVTEAVTALEQLLQRRSGLDTPAFYAVLKNCIARKDVVLGSHVHALAIRSGYDSNAFVANHLICMYASHGRLEEAMDAFKKVDIPNLYMWASIILTHSRHGRPREAIRLYRQMRLSTVKPDSRIFVAVLKACATAQDVTSGREVHADILKNKEYADIFVGNSLVGMYSKCGCLKDARTVFDNLPSRDVVTWTAMIAGYAQNGLGEEAINLYSHMQQEGNIRANNVTFVCLLQACAGIGSVRWGKNVHAEIIERGLETDLVVGTCLVDMYAKCRALEEARQLFDRLPQKNLVTWNAMIAGYAQNGLGFGALTLYEQMTQVWNTSADSVTFVCLLAACASIGALYQGKQLHAQIQERGLEANVVISNSLVNMYAKCGDFEHALKAFDKLQKKDAVTWNAMIAGYAQHGCSEEALALYDRMQQEDTAADPVTYVCLLHSCGSVAALKKGKEIHGKICRIGLEAKDLSVGNALIYMYVKCGCLEIARTVFDNMPGKDIISWTTMIAAYAQHELGEEALALYASMKQNGFAPADTITFACLLQACASLKAILIGKQLHAEVQERGFEADVVVGTCLVDMYAKCGSLVMARNLFDCLQNKNVVTWTAMLTGYSQHGLGQEALTLYGCMQAEGIAPANAVTFASLLQACASIGALQQGKQLHAQIVDRGLDADVVVGTCLVDMYAKCGSLENARSVFYGLPSKNVVTWNAMLAGYSQHGFGQEALTLYASMKGKGITPDNSVTFVYLLQACGNMAALELGREIHAEFSKMEFEATDLPVASTLIDMYCKCGGMVDAQHVFQALPVRDLVTWSALIAGYSNQGESGSVFTLFSRMRQEGIHPDGITFLSILNVCNHAGLVDEGQMYFEAMSRDYKITPTIEHYTCMVDLLGRAGHVDMAMEMAKMVPLKTDGRLWRCVLGSCQKWGKVELGREAFECAVRLDETDGAAYVLMSNIYAAAQMWDDERHIRAMRLHAQVRKDAGESWWTDFSGTVHTFMAGHAKWQYMDAKLSDIFVKLQEESPPGSRTEQC